MTLFAFTVALGDQRQLTVILSSPAQDDSMPLTLQQMSITFNAETNHHSVESRLIFDPPSPGTVRWRGNTLVYTFASALAPGNHRVTIAPGASGRAAERLAQPFTVSFTVRQPGVVVLQTDPQTGGQKLVAWRDGKAETLLTADSIAQFAVSPDGVDIAVVFANKQLTNLSLIDIASGQIRPLIQSPGITLGGVAWATDASALLVVRRDRLANGAESVPRVWLVRLNGEFVAVIDPSGRPSMAPVWSPDAQSVAYISPADGRLNVLNLSTHAVVNLGQPRGGTPAWSPDSRLVAFDGVPPVADSSAGLLQPVNVRSLDGTVDRTFGGYGDIQYAPAFLDRDTLMALRRVVSLAKSGTELLFESVKTGKVLRSVPLTSGSESVTAWQIDPLHQHIVFSTQEGVTFHTYVLSLVDGSKTSLPDGGDDPLWMP